MSITAATNAFVKSNATSINLSQMFTETASSGNPAYLVLTALDRNEYTAGASGATGSFSGNGHTLSLANIGGDGRGAGIVFTYQASTGRYYNSTYGYLDQLTYGAPGSWHDPAGGSPVRVRGSARSVASVASWKVTTMAKRTQQSCGVWD